MPAACLWVTPLSSAALPAAMPQVTGEQVITRWTVTRRRRAVPVSSPCRSGMRFETRLYSFTAKLGTFAMLSEREASPALNEQLSLETRCAMLLGALVIFIPQHVQHDSRGGVLNNCHRIPKVIPRAYQEALYLP